MRYYKLIFTIDPPDPGREILYAELEALPVESFVETETGVEAYFPEAGFVAPTADDFPMTSAAGRIEWTIETVEPKNWNEEWEKNFEPIEVGKDLLIRAPFHPPQSGEYGYEIVIEPKMSFGTGHHQTTWLMCRYLLDIDLEGRDVLDMGCGTSILAILARMRGAAYAVGVDIEEWAVENSRENAARNGFPDIAIYHGDAELLGDYEFDIILANINRNILMRDLPVYADVLRPGGQILLSGFYESDIPVLEELGGKLGLRPMRTETKDRWAALIWNKE